MNIEIIAELAQGFEGSKDQAKLLVKAAAKSGADAAKFQLIYADELATPDYDYYNLFSSLEMSDSDWSEIKATCDSQGIELILDIFGPQGLALAEKIEIKTVKLHATDINNIGFLSSISKSHIARIMLGAGGAFCSEILDALEILQSKEVILFHGFQGYPTSIESNQLSRIGTWKNIFDKFNNVALGFSDHVDPDNVTSISLPSFAIGLGATIIEKHLTLGRCMELEDHEAALNPDQFKIFSDSVKEVLIAYGETNSEDDFGMSDSEKNYRKAIRRHVVSSKEIEKGIKIDKSDLVLKRTSSENSIHDIKSVYGKVASRNIPANKPLNFEILE